MAVDVDVSSVTKPDEADSLDRALASKEVFGLPNQSPGLYLSGDRVAVEAALRPNCVIDFLLHTMAGAEPTILSEVRFLPCLMLHPL